MTPSWCASAACFAHDCTPILNYERIFVFLGQNALRSQQEALTRQWEGERAKLAAIQTLKEEVDAVSKDVERAERSYDLNRAAELKCESRHKVLLCALR